MSLYGVVRFILVALTRVLWRPRIEGAHHIPESGACILAPTHRSLVDIPLLGSATRRRIRYMGKREVFEWPVVGPFFYRLGSFAVARDGDDRAALRAALAILDRDGEPMAVYPEGTRQRGPEMGELQPGAAYLAIRAGVPLVPVGIAGSRQIMHDDDDRKRRFPHFGRTAVVVGEPLVVPDRDGGLVKRAYVDELTGRLAKSLAALTDEAEALRQS